MYRSLASIAAEMLILESEGWVRIRVTAKVEELRQFGPTLPVTVSANSLSKETFAQVDTGANHSCISERLADQMGIPPHGALYQHPAGSEPEHTAVFRCAIEFPNGTKIDADMAVLPSLSDPHDVLIGRDILQTCRLVVDFVTGEWEIHFKSPPP